MISRQSGWLAVQAVGRFWNMGFLAKLPGLVVIAIVSYILVEFVLLLAALVPKIIGWAPAGSGGYAPIFRLILLVTSAAFFTIPAFLPLGVRACMPAPGSSTSRLGRRRKS